MPDEVVKLLVIGALGTVSAVAAHRNIAIYHDGLRTSVDDVAAGRRTRTDLGAYGYRISIGFVIAFALPFSLASGIVIIHMIMLGGDVIGIRATRLALAAAGGLVWAMAIVGVVDLFGRLIDWLPLTSTGQDLLWLPLVYALPLLGAATATQVHGFRVGVIATLATLVIWGAAYLVLDAAVDDATVFGAGLVALAAVLLALVASALRARAEETTDLAFFEPNIRRIRRNALFLMLSAALIAVTGSYGWVGGEPVQVGLLATDHAAGAAAVALFSTVGFVPLQGMTGLVSGVWNQHGYPDWLLGVGYLTDNRLLAAVGGAALMGIELLTLRRVAWLLTARPGVATLGYAIREALEIVPTPAILAGAILAATAAGGPAGALVVVAVQILNDKRGRPVMPLAAPVFGYLLVLVGAGLIEKAGLFA